MEIVHQKRRVEKGWFPEGPGHKNRVDRINLSRFSDYEIYKRKEIPIFDIVHCCGNMFYGGSKPMLWQKVAKEY